jgi:RNA polymerase sigma-70 factor (ECF subfamily)
LLSTEELILHIRGSSLNNRESQKKIFSAFYGYAMSVCIRYTNKQEDATEILNDGFLKVFKEMHRFIPSFVDVMASFKGWLRKIMVYTAIDHNRKYYKYEMTTTFTDKIAEITYIEENALDKISYDEIIKAIRNLSPAYRTVLNLYIIEGFSHHEIAEKLGISIGTSKSNLSKAKIQLQKILFNSHQTVLIKNET